MASLMKLTSTTTGKLIMRQGLLQAIRGAASQAKLANKGADDLQKSDEVQSQEPSFETHDVYIHKTRDELKVSLDNVECNGLQREMVEKLGPYLKTTVTEEKLPNVTFNHIAEDVYLSNLYMTFRKMGYHCSFSRYNSDKGVAIFQRESGDESDVKHSVFRSQLPNIC